MADFVAYVRVSTTKQANSGLGLEAQRQRIRDFVGSDNVLEWFEDHESGSKSDRPELENALTLCELTNATLVVATLCRLGRDVLFLETVKRRADAAGFDFRCSDMPNANSFMLGVMAAVAQYEREQVAERTRRALSAARERGTKLGSPIGAKAFKGRQCLGIARAAESHRARATAWAEKRRALFAELQAAGLSLSGMTRELTARGITTRRGGRWHARTVKNLLDRLELVAAA